MECPENCEFGSKSEKKNQLKFKTATSEVLNSSGDMRLEVARCHCQVLWLAPVQNDSRDLFDRTMHGSV